MAATPSEEGFAMPAEWEKHEATWLSWPKNPDTFPSGILPKVETAYVRMVEALGDAEEVRILVDDERQESHVRGLVPRSSRVVFIHIRTVDVWVRDYGPTYVRGRGMAVVKWNFNAWGKKYDDLLPDDEAGERIAQTSGLRVFRPGLVLEGGSIEVNGRGTVITTEQCLLNPNRNPSYDRKDLEEELMEYLGAPNVVWLRSGIEGDDTDGHVDDIARFVSARTLVAGVEEKASDPNHATLKENLGLLEAAVDNEGRPFKVVTLPMPPRVDSPDGRLPASHLNFYVGNDCVLLPQFGGESDRLAAEALQEAFPGREVVGIDCRALVYGLGTLHCVTQQVPM